MNSAFLCATLAYTNAIGIVFLKTNVFLAQLMLEKIVLYLMACLSFVSYQLEVLLVSIVVCQVFCSFIMFTLGT